MKRNPLFKTALRIVPGFTLIEILIVVTIISILTGGFVISFNNLRIKGDFEDHEAGVLSLINQARTLALSNVQHDTGEATAYYELGVSVDSNALVLSTYDINGISQTIDRYDLDDSTSIYSDACGDNSSGGFSIIYTPPYGEISFSDDSQIKTLYICSEDNLDYNTSITIDIYGGFPEVE